MNLFVMVLLVTLGLIGFTALAFISQEQSNTAQQSPEQRSLRDSEYVDRAKRYEEQDRHERAVQNWTRYLKEDEDNGWGYYRRAVCFLKQGQYQRAVHDFEEAAKRVEDPPASFYKQYAQTLRQGRRYDEARRMYNIYLKQEPKDGSAWLELGLMLEGRDRDEAIAALKNASEHGSKTDRAEALLALVDLELDHNVAQARRYFAKLDADSVRTMGQTERSKYDYQKARLSEEAGKADKALRLYLQIDSTYRDISRRISGLLSGKGDYPSFIRSLDDEQQAGIGRIIMNQRGLSPVDVISHDPLKIKASTHSPETDSVRVQHALAQFDWSDEVYDREAIRDFERELVRKSYRRGLLVSFGDLTEDAAKFLRDSARAEFVGKKDVLRLLSLQSG